MKPRTLAMAAATEYVETLLAAVDLAHGIARATRLLSELDDETADRLLREALDDPET